MFITVTEGRIGEKNWECGRWREEGEKTKQKEPNHHILVREQPGNMPKNPEGQGVGPLSFECNVLLIHFSAVWWWSQL